MPSERCIRCEELTGRAGVGEDSLYFGDVGPFCEVCFARRTNEPPEESHE